MALMSGGQTIGGSTDTIGETDTSTTTTVSTTSNDSDGSLTVGTTEERLFAQEQDLAFEDPTTTDVEGQSQTSLISETETPAAFIEDAIRDQDPVTTEQAVTATESLVTNTADNVIGDTSAGGMFGSLVVVGGALLALGVLFGGD